MGVGRDVFCACSTRILKVEFRISNYSFCPPLQIGQRHKGFIGMFEETLSKCAHHIWFERSESKDRQIITQR